ncbi:sedoheptulokinase-like isoform X2 [Physella acuta]|nr:sedoheptulokinase-like isoform X2 [Physella acuta]XP_059143764.1 sedoheptulokinase-like isoform X2 [Physella acuta]XP_059143766.1 sedoheptulokinase-like isoform X2 [Physella acuta]XP_059143767.1 sedoheptulokinase-like isoform X2 [Physella acuta]XP_059143768.1 sedoheptulokinase-like isoform X2 [Physella acuta]
MASTGQDALWLGVDLGTTSVKAVLINQYAETVSSSSLSTSADVKSEIGSSGYEQNVLKIFSTIQNVVVPLIAEVKHNIKGIGVTGQMHGVVLWQNLFEGKQNSFLKINESCCSHLFTWQDQRCSEDFIKTLPSSENSQTTLSTGHGCATIFWLAKNKPTFFTDGNFTCCGTIMDLLVSVLCGLERPVTSDQLAASLGYYDESTQGWSSALSESSEFPCHLLPKIVPSGTPVGRVSSSHDDWPVDVPVYVGMGDVQCAMYALLKSHYDAAVNISTSIQLGFIIANKDKEQVREESPPSISFFPYFNDQQLALCAGLNGGNAIQHFVECVGQWFTDLETGFDIPPSLLLQKLLKLSQNANSTDTLTFSPVFFGERHDPASTGHISGINSINFSNIGAIFRATCQGIVSHLHCMVPAKYLLDRGIQRLLLSGSVAVNNPVVKERLIELYTVPGELSVLVDLKESDAVASAAGAAKLVRDKMVDWNNGMGCNK